MMSTVLKLVQGSPEWHAYRKEMRNASESPAVLGISPWVTPYGLWLVKTGRSTQATTEEAMAHGTKLEPEARTAYEEQTGEIMNPLVLQDGLYSASLDGINLAGDLICEIKCPFRAKFSALWKEAKEGRVPGHYNVQIQHQLMVAGAATAHLWVYAGGEGLLITVRRDEEVMGLIREAWDDFQQYLDGDTPPPLTDADSAQRTDEAWSQAAQAYLDAKTKADAADTALDTARKALVELSRHPRESGEGVNVVKLWKQGNVDYKKVPELKGVNLDRYRGQGREEVRVTVVK
jgi:putative phage-type endonuclease